MTRQKLEQATSAKELAKVEGQYYRDEHIDMCIHVTTHTHTLTQHKHTRTHTYIYTYTHIAHTYTQIHI